jgi:hypothetical protein
MGGLIPLNLLSTNTCVMGGGGGPMSCGDMTGGLLGLNLLSTNTCMSMKNAEVSPHLHHFVPLNKLILSLCFFLRAILV